LTRRQFRPRAQRSPPAVAAPPALRGSATTASFIRRITFDRPDWTTGAHAFQPVAGDDGGLPPPPLFAPPHARALLSSMLATFHDGPEVDVDRVSALVAEGRRVDTIPYVPVPTLRCGAQLLVDRSDAMDPLRDDVEQIKAELLRLFGRGHLEVLEFAHCPSARESRRRGVSVGPRARPNPWRSPGPGVPVLIVSDFALSAMVGDDVDNATAAEWHEFAGDVLAAGCHPVGLVPYPPSRWPPALARAITFVHWSERTTARQVLRALRETRRSAAPLR
jgi:hypothetical protein